MRTPYDDPTCLPIRDIMCIDCKAFYASTEAIRRAEYPLASKIAVLSRAESEGGLILAASPDTKKDYGVKLGTRKYEIKSDMDIQLVAPHMMDYIKLNYRIRQIIGQFTDVIHTYSCDEFLADFTHSHLLFGSNLTIAQQLQEKIYAETGIVTTIGIGPNPLMAKLALDNAAKVSAPWRASWSYSEISQTVWKIQNLTDFWSIGSKTAQKLEKMGIHSIYELAHADIKELHKKFGVLGDALYYHSWGIDYSDLSQKYLPKAENKGYGNSQVLMRTYVLLDDIETVLFEITDQVATRLRKHHVQGSVVSIQVGFEEPNAKGQRGWSAQTQIDSTNQTTELIRAVKYLIEKNWHDEPVRNLGVRVNRIRKAEAVQLSIFEDSAKYDAEIRLSKTVDKIRDRYGYKSLIRGYSKKESGTAVERSRLVGGHQA